MIGKTITYDDFKAVRRTGVVLDKYLSVSKLPGQKEKVVHFYLIKTFTTDEIVSVHCSRVNGVK